VDLATAPTHDVAVAILTYQRPDLVVRAMHGALREIEGLAIGGRLIVIDNDPDRSALEAVMAVGSPLVRYIAEPQPGIPAARNAALDAAAECRLLAFMDDDEVPEPGWLKALIDAWATWGCDGVAGPNVRLLDGSEDPWVTASRFFARTSRVDGVKLPGAPTSNLLLDLETVRRLGLRFDSRFDNTGGSDTLFTGQLAAAGGVIRWCERAVTSEPVPPERATRTWVLARERRIGNTWSRVHLVLAHGRVETTAVVLRLLMGGMKLLAFGVIRFAAGIVGGDLGRRAVGECEIARGRGLLLGLRGGRVEEYRRD